LKFLYNSNYFFIVGLVLHKAEVEGRDYQQKITPKQQQVCFYCISAFDNLWVGRGYT